MNEMTSNMRPKRMFMGTPQVDKIQVYKVPSGRSAVLTQVILSNTDAEESKLTITINTIDIMRDYVVGAGETKVIDLYVVLNEDDTVSLQQEKANAVNVTLNGSAG